MIIRPNLLAYVCQKFYVYRWREALEAEYLIFRFEDVYYALNQKTLSIYTSRDFNNVLRYALANVSENGKILLDCDKYILSEPIRVTKPVTIDGFGAEIINKTDKPFFIIEKNVKGVALKHLELIRPRKNRVEGGGDEDSCISEEE